MAALEVVAGVLRDPAGRVLLAQRAPGTHLAGLWEFPGGKREAGESPHDALARELHEELGIAIGAAQRLLRVPWSYPRRRVNLDVLEVADFTGQAHGREGQQLAWVAIDQLHRWPMPDADRPVIAALQLPREYAITADPLLDEARLCASATRLLADGARLLQLRAKSLPRDAMRRVLDAVAPAARSAGAIVLLNADVDLAAQVEAIGVHLTAAQLHTLDTRPMARPRWVAASCHDAAEIERAVALDCDFIVLAPVQATASHPHARPLGWPALADLCAAAPLPAFALGGLARGDLGRAQDAGAFGIAGISAFDPRP